MKKFFEVVLSVVLLVSIYTLLATGEIIASMYAGKLIGFIVEFITRDTLIVMINTVIGSNHFVSGDLGSIFGVVFAVYSLYRCILSIFNAKIEESNE